MCSVPLTVSDQVHVSAGALQQVQEHPEAEVSATRLASAWPATISLA